MLVGLFICGENSDAFGQYYCGYRNPAKWGWVGPPGGLVELGGGAAPPEGLVPGDGVKLAPVPSQDEFEGVTSQSLSDRKLPVRFGGAWKAELFRCV